MLLQTTNRRSGLSIVWFLNIYSSIVWFLNIYSSIDVENIFNLISKLPALITQLSNVHIVWRCLKLICVISLANELPQERRLFVWGLTIAIFVVWCYICKPRRRFSSLNFEQKSNYFLLLPIFSLMTWNTSLLWKFVWLLLEMSTRNSKSWFKRTCRRWMTVLRKRRWGLKYNQSVHFCVLVFHVIYPHYKLKTIFLLFQL